MAVKHPNIIAHHGYGLLAKFGGLRLSQGAGKATAGAHMHHVGMYACSMGMPPPFLPQSMLTALHGCC